MNKLKSTFMVSLLFIAMLLVSGCESNSYIKIGWIGNHTSRKMNASFQSFTGSEVGTINAKNGEIILIEYSATVEKGDLSIEVQSKSKEVLWEKAFSEKESDFLEYRVDRDEKYRIVIKGDNAKGSFEVTWKIAE